MSNVDRVLAVVLGGMLLPPCGACSQKWKFARADDPVSHTPAPDVWPYVAPGASESLAGSPAPWTPTYATSGLQTPLNAVPPGQSQPARASYYSHWDTPGVIPAGGTASLAAGGTASLAAGGTASLAAGGTTPLAAGGTASLAAGGTEPGPAFPLPESPVFDPVPPAVDRSPYAPQSPSAPCGFGERLRSGFQELHYNVRSDHRNYYSWITMRDLLLGVAGGSVLANTSLDEDFQHWYQRDVRSPGSDDFAAFWKTFGEGQIFIPAFAGLAVVGGICEDRPLLGCAGDFGDRVTRGYLVGAPPMLLMQYLLGSSRPEEASVGSQWKPFDDSNAVSGHAFMGAVPFITAAKMAENPWAKSTLYICSTLTAWSRVNDNDHYLSQACLGWWMAYLACRAVDETEQEDRFLTFTPLVTPELSGVGMVVRR